MQTELVVAGVVCVVAAAVGGGLKLLGAEIPVLASTARQVLLAVVGAGLVAGALAMPSAQEQADESAGRQQRQALVRDLAGRLEDITTDINRSKHGTEVPGLYRGTDIPRLTDVYEDLRTNRAALGDFHAPLRKKADLAVSLANAETSEQFDDVAARIAGVNDEITRLSAEDS